MSGKIFKETQAQKQEEKLQIVETCSHCGKEISRKGSFTAFLFSDTRCKCVIASSSTAATAIAPTSKSLSENSSLSHFVTESVPPSDNSVVIKPDLGERYEVLELIGQGGMGAVWKVRDRAIEKTLAVKVLRQDLASDRVAVKRFEQEALASGSLTQANLCAVYGTGVAKDNSPFLIMDFLDGENLADLLKREVYLPIARAIDIANQVGEALSHAHSKGIVHRDLKPSNIIVTKSADGNDIVKIVDFGIAKLMPSVSEQTNNLTQTGDLFGSPLYMSPEQCNGDSLDSRSDIYSMGCVMYEVLTGRQPFAAVNPIQTILKHINEEPARVATLNGQISKDLEYVVMRCLQKNPADRYQSVNELLQNFQEIQNGVPIKQIQVLDQSQKETQRLRKIELERLAAGILFLQVLPWLFLFVITPAYISPLVRSPIGLCAVVAILCWEALGIWFRYRVRLRSEFQSTLQYMAVQIFCIMPAIVLPFIGPAVITILTAIAPIISGGK